MKPTNETASRREFLKFAGVGAPAVAIAAASAESAEAEAEEARDVGPGLRKTAHVKKYLETARF